LKQFDEDIILVQNPFISRKNKKIPLEKGMSFFGAYE